MGSDSIGRVRLRRDEGINQSDPIDRMDHINTAYERMLRSDVKYRFVIDMARF